MLDRLRAIVGTRDWPSIPSRWRRGSRIGVSAGAATRSAVVAPASTAEAAATVALCAAEDQPIFSVGGNTGLCFGAVPESDRPGKPGIVLSLRRMNRIRAIDPAAGVATVDAGVVLGDLHAAAAEVRRQFPLHLGSEGSAQIGGLISTNAGGTGVVRYGPMRDLVAGLEVVLADGRVLSDLAALRKDNTGYMLRHLFIGAEGTLGVITGAALRLHSQTPNTAHAWVSVTNPAAAVALFTALQDRAGSTIQAFELVSASQFELVRRHIERVRIPFAEIPAWSVLIELGAEDANTALNAVLEEVVGAALESSRAIDAVVAASEQQAADFWHVRHSVSEGQQGRGHRASCMMSRCAPRISRRSSRPADKVAAARYPQAVAQVVCHLGDGNVHYILMFQHAFWNSLKDPDALRARGRGRDPRRRGGLFGHVQRRARYRPQADRGAAAARGSLALRADGAGEADARPARPDESRRAA
jgi:FAD/FMN-containing dehydrogenase